MIRSLVNTYISRIGFILILFAFTHLYDNFLLAQQKAITFNSITTEEGLVDDVAITVLQDNNGFIWIGTRAGLVRFDGKNLQNYSYDPNMPDGLIGNSISSLHLDNSGNIWIGTLNGLCYFDPILDRPVYTPLIIDEKIIYPNIRSISSSSNGKIWIGTLDHGLISFDPESNKIEQFLTGENEHYFIVSKRIFSLICGSGDKIWIGTDKGLNIFDQESESFTLYKHEEGNPNSLSGNIITAITEGEKGEFWIGTQGFGLNRLNTKTGEIKNYRHDPNNEYTVSDNFISTVTYNDNAIWLGAGRSLQSLNKLDLNTGLVSRIKISNDNQQVLGGALNEIFIDRTGIVWIVQGLTGVKYFDPAWQNFEQYMINIENFGSIENRAYGICPISNTQVWISTFDGPKLYDLKKGVLKEIKANDAQFLNGNAIIVNNEIWFPSRINGVVRLNQSNRRLKYIDHDPKSNSGLSSNYVNTIIKDQEEIVWIGSRDGGLDRVDPKTNKITKYNNDEDDPHSLPENSVYTIYEVSKNELWIGTNGGLSIFNKVSEKFETYNYDPNNPASISSDLISYIIKSKKGDIWIATYGGGLNRFNPEKKSFTRYTAQNENIPNNTIYSLVEDEMGYIWVSTVSGIGRFSPETGFYDNLIPLIDNYKVNKFPNGKLIFSGPRGILVFDPQKIKINSVPPLVSLTNFYVKSKTTPEERIDSLKYILATQGSIDLEYNQNDISFEFMAAHYSNAKKNKYKVFMEGYDNDWRSLGNFGNINYTNLDPGEYNLSVMASNAYDLWSKSPVEYKINIKKPWWQTWWAYSMYILMVFGFLYSIRKFELNRQRKNAAIKESKLRAEAAELQAKAAEAQSRAIQAENERKTHELEEARKLQLSMLPKEIPQLPNLDIAVYMKTATEVGGDYYDFHLQSDGTLTVVLGDATGHGMQSGMMVSVMKSLFMADRSNKELAPFFEGSNQAIKDMQLGRLMMALTSIQFNSHKIKVANAGMPSTLIYRKNSNSIEEIAINNLPLGGIKDFDYETREEMINPGDTILMMSDGYPELSNNKGEQMGYTKMKNYFTEAAEKKPDEIIEYLGKKGLEWSGSNDNKDDITFVVIKVKKNNLRIINENSSY